ncbi:hypothetical protein WJR50_08610 [Catalinimonas sp. 4WD22]|uniref:hypothetical protein n=1 Tax=Catalinimonas locisalis TaxID=3133978 RepID=UPI003100D688
MERKDAPYQSFKEEVLPLLLLERLSLRGISRVLGQSLTWIDKRMRVLWDSLPKELPIGRLDDALIDLYCLEAAVPAGTKCGAL